MPEQVGIKVKTIVDSSDLDKLRSTLDNVEGKTVTAKTNVDTEDSQARLREVMERIGAIDGETATVKTNVDDNATDELSNIQRRAGDLDGLSPVIKPTVDGSEAISELDNIQSKAEGMSGLESGIGGLLGTIGASQLLGSGVETATNMDKAWRNWVGSLQQSGVGLDAAKKKADGFYKTVNNLASVGQSNDGFFKSIAGLMISYNTSISDSTLKMTENVVAGYEMLGGRTGATMYEMEKELKNFLANGEMGKMEDTLSSLKDPQKWMGLLKGADTAEERISVLKDMLQEEGIMGALNIDAPSKSIDQLKALFDASMTNIGTTLINIIKPIADGFMWLDTVTGGASTSIMSLTAVIGLLGVGLVGIGGYVLNAARSFTGLFSSIKSGSGLLGSLGKGAGLAANTVELEANTVALVENTAALEANNVARATSGGAGAAAKGLGQLGSVGAAAGSAAPGAAAGASGFAAISASITSMLIPLIAISAVIAIMIPIIAGLAIEVLLFVRLIGEVVKALGFDKLNLKPAIEGIKQIGLAMFEIGRAFAVLVGINILGIVYNATGGIIGTSIALAQFWTATKEIEVILKDINSLHIDQSSVAKINALTNVLVGITNSMKNMAKLNIAGFVTLLTGGVDGIKANIRNIEEIGKAIQGMNIPEVDSNKITLINSLSDVIKKLSEASQSVDDATGWFNEKVLNIDDVEGIAATLRNLAQIARNINSTDIPTVNQDKVGLVKALSDVVKPLAEAGKAVDEAQGFFGDKVLNIEDVKGMQATLRNIGYIATNINSTDIPAVDKGKIDAVRNIKNVIMPIVESAKAISDNWQSIVATPGMATPFGNAIQALYVINQKLNSTAFSIDPAKIQAITNMKTVIAKVAEIGLYLSQNSGNIGSNITSNASVLSSSIGSLYVVNQKINSSAFALAPEKVTAIGNLKPFIQRVAEIGLYLSQNSGNLGAIAANQGALSGAIQSLYVINQKINSMPFQIDSAKASAIASLKSLIQTVVSTLSAANGVQSAAQNMGSKITTGFKTGAKNLVLAVNTVLASAITAVQSKYNTMYSAGNALGLKLVAGFKAGAGIHSPMAAVVSGLDDTINHIRGLASHFYSAGSDLGSSLTSGWTDEQKAQTSVSELLKSNSGSVMSIFNNAGINWSGSSAAGGSGISAAGGGDIGYDIEYPSPNYYDIHLNGLVTEQGMIDKLMNLIKKGQSQDNLRT